MREFFVLFVYNYLQFKVLIIIVTISFVIHVNINFCCMLIQKQTIVKQDLSTGIFVYNYIMKNIIRFNELQI